MYTGIAVVQFDWDPNKAASNLRKHGVRFAEAMTVFDDDGLLVIADDNPDEDRFIAIGMGSRGRSLVVVYASRDERIRIISARPASRHEQSEYERKR